MGGYKVDNTTRGPRRWERAALNALRNPHSQAAELYRTRTALALQVAEAAQVTLTEDVPYEFMQLDWQSRTSKRVYATCSIHCTVLQATLDYGVKSLTELRRVFDGTHRFVGRGSFVRKLNRAPENMARSMRCQVCAKEIKRKA